MKCYLIGLLSMLSVHAAMGQQAIDVHCHNILPTFKELLDRHGATLEETFPLPDWDVASHLKFMKEAGIETSVLSMPAPQPWFGDVEESRCAVRQYNETCSPAESGLSPANSSSVLHCPCPMWTRLSRKRSMYSTRSARTASSWLPTAGGQYVGDAALDTLMQVLNEHHAVVMLHPHKPSPVNDGIIATAPLAVYEYPAETTRTVVNLIARNVPARYPNLKFIVPHCGSFLPLALPRMKAVYLVMAAKGLMEPIDWNANLKAFYYDLAGGATPEVVKVLLTITTPDRLLYGSDYPYQPATVLTGNLKQLRTWITDDAELTPFAEKILHDNALKLFGK
ncbi:amidohydrolase [Bacteroides fragilis]|nr:amidohydrolase [Bacteroides fragilis]